MNTTAYVSLLQLRQLLDAENLIDMATFNPNAVLIRLLVDILTNFEPLEPHPHPRVYPTGTQYLLFFTAAPGATRDLAGSGQ